jgi:hypothetical protein
MSGTKCLNNMFDTNTVWGKANGEEEESKSAYKIYI